MRSSHPCYFCGGIASCFLIVLLAPGSADAAKLQTGDSPHPQSASSSAPQTIAKPDLQEAVWLEPGKPIERALTGTETHHYHLNLQKGQCGAIRVEQRGINVAVQLLGRDNDLLVEVDDELGKQGTEKLDIVADDDGTYTVAVRPKLKVASGAYEIHLAEVRTATGLDRTLYESRKLRTKASYRLNRAKPEEAFPLAQRALTLGQQALGPDDPYVGLLTRDLAEITYQSGKPREAEKIFAQVLQVLTAKLGAEHAQTLLTKSRLGAVYAEQLEDYSKGDQLLGQALESEERALGKDDPLLAGALRSLGVLHLHLGDYVKAEHEFQRALAILEGAGLTEEPGYSRALSGLGIVCIIQRKLDQATIYLERELAIEEARFGPDSPALWKVLNNLGIVAKKKRDYPAAEKYYRRALAINRPEIPDYASTLSNLGNVYMAQGDYQKALDTHLRAFSIMGSPASRRMELGDIATIYTALGDFANANKTQAQAESALENEIALKLAIGSERQKLAYLDSVASNMDDTISLNLQFQPENSEAAALAATATLRRKGRVLDAMTDTLSVLRKHSDRQDQALLDQLKEATTQLAQVALGGPEKQSPEEYRKFLQDLQGQKEKLENAISHHSEEFRAQLQPVTLEAVRSAIPFDSALIEFVTFHPSNPKAQTYNEQYGALRYGAYILHRNAALKGIDLGDAKAIDAAVERLRAALREPSRKDVRQLAQALAEKVFQPLDSLVAGDKRLLISADGQLNLIPFEALLDGQGRFVVERFSINYLTTGRDLLRMQVPRPSRSAPVLVADPLFGEPNGPLVASAAMPQVKPARARTVRRSITTGADFSSLYFAPLEGTRTEARSIHDLFPEARVLTGEQASEAALERLNAPTILHIATHGFFLQDASQKADVQAGGQAAASGSPAEPENPLLRSGLALSGANLAREGKGNGILTALEAANLDLWGTKLVTLSACDTVWAK